jgi:hypothetical protein
LFLGYLTGVSFGLQAFYGGKNTADLIGKISIFECIFLLLLMAGYSVFISFKPEYFGEYVK